MGKPSLLLAAAMLAGSAHAESTFREFSYTGFLHQEAGQFLPNAQIRGSFDSEDVNRDGVLDLGEVTSFVLNGQQYVGACGADVFLCGLFEFSYTPGGSLNFNTAWSTDPWNENGVAGGEAISGFQVQEYAFWNGNETLTTLRWTADTRFAISPVPEPATYGMLALGLGVLALSGRRARRA